jgi:hypothetical protein
MLRCRPQREFAKRGEKRAGLYAGANHVAGWCFTDLQDKGGNRGLQLMLERWAAILMHRFERGHASVSLVALHVTYGNICAY